jgi:hypothetical protein
MPVPYSAASDALGEYSRRRQEREMREALEADGEKLRQLTGQDHGPEFLTLATCDACDGLGYHAKTIHIYEAGCGFSHPDVHDTPCEYCGGTGEIVAEL